MQKLRPVCQFFHYPVCLLAQRRGTGSAQAVDFHQVLHESLREARYTYRYLVFIVEKHVNSFLIT